MYRNTVNLPKTDFPMKANLVGREPAMLQKWQESGIYEQIIAARKDAELYLLHDGPPFANGNVHMGTALNKILKDLVIKSKSMFGYYAPFLPGWDCHGLPIEFKVVKASRGLNPLEVRRKSEELARKFVRIQRAQFERLGVFGDWDHPYLTLDPGYEAEILRSFAVLVEKDLVYQSKKPVYWSTGAQTALAEAEVEYEERTDPAIYVKFPIKSGPLAGQASVVIWTTTPWTIPANLAIAVNPTFRYRANGYFNPRTGKTERLFLADGLVEQFCKDAEVELVASDTKGESWLGTEIEGWKTQHPLFNRESPLVIGDHVTLDAGTGSVHTAPGHGNDDYIMGRKYDLQILSPVDDLGRFTEDCGIPEVVGKYVFDANPQIVQMLDKAGALVKVNDYVHSYPHCWRSKTPIVFRAVEQFFVRMDNLRVDALHAIDTVKWIPAWGRNRIYGTVESRPDWCISRQRSWGVPVPVFYDENGKAVLKVEWIRKFADLVEKQGTNCWFDTEDQTIAKALQIPEGYTRRPDTLDVWIDSGVSSEAVVRKMMGVKRPSDLYLEATDQHRGWFQSSLVMEVALRGHSPYKTCLTHGFVVDVDTKKKISKSAQGTPGYDKPTEAEHFVSKYGADIVRLWVSSVNFTDEVPFGEEVFARVSETYRRLRNTLRILLANLNDSARTELPEEQRQLPTGKSLALGELALVDRWILHQLQELIETCRNAYERFEFHRVYHAINHFCAVDLSSLYIDVTKDRMYCDAPNSPRRRATQSIMQNVFETLCKLIAPICAFTAQEAWQYFGKPNSIHLEMFPQPDEKYLNPEVAQSFEQRLKLRAAISQEIEKARQEKLIGNALEAEVTLKISNPKLYNELLTQIPELEELFVLSKLRIELVESLAEPVVELKPTTDKKCERCWRYLPSVGKSKVHPTLCDRCESVVVEQGLPATD